MTHQEILNHAPSLFDTSEKWNIFTEIANTLENIRHHWFEIAAEEIRRHFIAYPSVGWIVQTSSNSEDVALYLEDYNPGLHIAFYQRYEFGLYLYHTGNFDSDKITSMLRERGYSKIYTCFDRLDRSLEANVKIQTRRPFKFGCPNDGNIPPEELAWYAGNKKDEFVKQAIEQIEKITKDEDITDLIRKLNQNTRIDKSE